MYPVHTFSSSMYPKTYIFYRFVPGTYQYILEKKSMYRVHTSGKSMYQVQTVFCRFILVSYYSMVHPGTYRYVLGTYYWSRFQMASSAIKIYNTVRKKNHCNVYGQAPHHFNYFNSLFRLHLFLKITSSNPINKKSALNKSGRV